jgi:tRNA modification GTPase
VPVAVPPETIAAIATPPGRGAVAVVRVSGAAVRGVAAKVFRSRTALAPRTAVLGEVIAEDGIAIDRGLALFFPAPHSYTGEDVLELHVHGSPAVARDTLIAALAAGARLATPGEFTRRAFLAGKLDLSAAEAVADLIESEARGAARAAAARLSGGLATEVERQRKRLGATLERLAAALDFPDEVESASPAELEAEVAAVDAGLAALAATWETGRLVRDGLAVAIVGPPNAGKSSLLNALLGFERALVSARPGTTRDTIEEVLALGDGAVARIVDTAGLRPADDELELAGMARSEAALDTAGVLLVVVDGAAPLPGATRDLLARTRGRERVVYFNKRDLGSAGYDARDAAEADALFGSVHDRAAVDAVRSALARHGAAGVDTARPMLGTARQADAVLQARRGLAEALATLRAGAPVDLIAGDLAHAQAALGHLTGRDAGEALLDAVFARFCIGK